MDESPKRGLLAAYRRLLGPLVRILIRNGVTFEEFAEVAKHSFVKVALKDFDAEEQKDPDNRVAALTGLDSSESREITNLLKATSDQDQSHLDQIVGLLASWHTDSDFTGPYGVPLELKLKDDDKSDFFTLSNRHIPEIEPEEILEKLIKIGIVIETHDGWFKVLKRDYMPEGDAPDGLEHLARTFQDIVNTLDHNRLENNENNKLFERQVYTEDGIREEDLPRFQAFANKKAQILLEELDNWLTQLEKPEAGKKKRLSTGLGIFNYVHRDDE